MTVEVGEATGLLHIVQLKPDEGAHEMFPSPIATSCADAPLHKSVTAEAFTVGTTTSTNIESFATQLPIVAVT